MKIIKFQIVLLASVVLFSCNNNNQVELHPVSVERSAPEIISIDLKPLLYEFHYTQDRYKANKKYVGKVLKVKGRTNGVNEDGVLRMQVRPGENPLWCYGLPDDFLLTVNEEDIVEITGTFEREDLGFMGEVSSKLVNCIDYEIVAETENQ